MSDKTDFVSYLESITAEGWHVVGVQLQNSSTEPISLIIEPLGDQVMLAPGARYEVIGQQPTDYGMLVEFSQKCIQVWVEGFSGVFENEVALETTYYLICRERMQESIA